MARGAGSGVGRGAGRLAATLLLGAAVCHAQEFSADVVYLDAGKPVVQAAASQGAPPHSSKLFVSKDQLRLETRGLDYTILLVNAGEHTAQLLYPARKMYQPLAKGPSQYFRVVNAEHACADWQQAVDHKIACERVGAELVAGRRTVKYRNTSAPGAASATVWIDAGLRYVVKWTEGAAGAELRNIREAPQAAELFTVPAGYEPLKPQNAKSGGFAHRPQ